MQPKRIALYCRCSTSDQSVDLQLDGLRDYTKTRGFEVVEEFLDEGVSGAEAKMLTGVGLTPSWSGSWTVWDALWPT